MVAGFDRDRRLGLDVPEQDAETPLKNIKIEKQVLKQPVEEKGWNMAADVLAEHIVTPLLSLKSLTRTRASEPKSKASISAQPKTSQLRSQSTWFNEPISAALECEPVRRSIVRRAVHRSAIAVVHTVRKRRGVGDRRRVCGCT